MIPPTTEQTPSEPVSRDLMSLFCQRFNCPPSEFEEQAFRKCLYWHARILAPLIRRLSPGFFTEDFTLIGYFGKAPGRRDAQNELAAFMEANRSHRSFARKHLLLRISARKAGELAGQLFETRPRREPPAPPAPDQ